MTDLERLRQLREAYDPDSPYKSAERAFAEAAHVALGHEGCVTFLCKAAIELLQSLEDGWNQPEKIFQMQVALGLEKYDE
jgi:hypothetical protein